MGYTFKDLGSSIFLDAGDTAATIAGHLAIVIGSTT